VSASEIIKELPKLSEAVRRAVLNKLRALAVRQMNRLQSLTAWKNRPPLIAPSIYAHVASARIRLAIFVLD
jgi:hypothetical protein